MRTLALVLAVILALGGALSIALGVGSMDKPDGMLTMIASVLIGVTALGSATVTFAVIAAAEAVDRSSATATRTAYERTHHH